jgi:hypothetical protein
MSKLDAIFQKEMTRQQFLAVIGAAIVSLFGLGALLGALTKEEKPDSGRNVGYGISNYGP